MKDGAEADIPALASKQDKADGCLLMHASNAAKVASQVIVCLHTSLTGKLLLNFGASQGGGKRCMIHMHEQQGAQIRT